MNLVVWDAFVTELQNSGGERRNSTKQDEDQVCPRIQKGFLEKTIFQTFFCQSRELTWWVASVAALPLLFVKQIEQCGRPRQENEIVNELNHTK